MAGVGITVDVDDTKLTAFLRGQIAKMENLRPFFANVGEHMLNSVEDRFDTQTAPDGSAWTPLSPVTVAGRLKRHGNAELTILRESGRLAGSFNYNASVSQVTIGTPMVYAALQHFGGQAGRNKSVTIPARPILGVSAHDENVITQMAEDFLRY